MRLITPMQFTSALAARLEKMPGKSPVTAIALLCVVACPYAGSPVMSGLELYGGDRGLMLVLSADGPFDVTTAMQTARHGTAASAVTVTAKGLIYGIESTAFGQFPEGCPVKHIAVKENTKSRMVVISLKMATKVSVQPKARQKGSGWLILLAETPMETFAWKAAEAAAAPENPPAAPPAPARAASVSSAPAPAASAPPAPQPVRQEVPASSAVKATPAPAAPPATQPVEKRPASAVPPVGLTDVRRVRRGTIEDIIFVFNSSVHWVAKRQETQVLVAFENAANSTANDLYSLAPSPTYASLKLGTARRGGMPWLIAAIHLQEGDGRSFVVMTSESAAVTVSTDLSDSIQRLAVWSTAAGLAAAYDFAPAPAGTQDYGTMRSKAEKDSKRRISAQETFTLREPSAKPAVPPTPEEKPTAQARMQPPAAAAEAEAPAAPPQPVPPPPAKPAPVKLVVMKDRANLRSEAGTEEGSRIVTRLPIGTEASQMALKGDWRRVETPQGTGWIHRSLVEEYDKVPESFWSALKPASDQEAAARQTEQLVSTLQQRAPLPLPKDTVKAPTEAVAQPTPPAPAAAQMRRDTLVPPAAHVIEYHVYGRDPFMPLRFGEDDSSDLPSVDRLRLVGILYDETDRIALFEDTKLPGRAYAFREADEIKNGKVLQIQENSVVLLVTEFDISRTVTLRLAKAAAPAASARRSEEGAPGAERATGTPAPGTPSTAGTSIPAWATPQAVLQRQQEAAAAAAPPVPGLPPIDQQNAKYRRRGGWAAESGK